MCETLGEEQRVCGGSLQFVADVVTVRATADGVQAGVCSQSWDVAPAVSLLCEYGTRVFSCTPRLSALCLQVSNLLQLRQTNSVPTSAKNRCRFALVRP